MKQPFAEVAKFLVNNNIDFYPIGRFLCYSHGKKVKKAIAEDLAFTTMVEDYNNHHAIVVSKVSVKAFKKLFKRDTIINKGTVFSHDTRADPDGKYVYFRSYERKSKNELYIEIEAPSGGWYLIVLLSDFDFGDLEQTKSAPLLKKTKKQLLAGQFF